MYDYLNQQAIFNQPLRLSDQKSEQPITVLRDYFRDYHLCDVRHHLWEMVATCLTTDNPPFDDAANRADLLLFYARTEKLLEAVLLLRGPATPEQ